MHPEQSLPERGQDEVNKRNTQLHISSTPDGRSVPAVHGQDQVPWTEQPLPIPEHNWGRSIHANTNAQQWDLAQVSLRTTPERFKHAEYEYV